MNEIIIFLLILSNPGILFHENVCILDTCDIDTFIVKDYTLFPERCQNKYTVGCSVYGPLTKEIYLLPIQYIDEFGFTTFEHEALHVLCECQFHMMKEIREEIKKQENPFDFVLKYKNDINDFIFDTMQLTRL